MVLLDFLCTLAGSYSLLSFPFPCFPNSSTFFSFSPLSFFLLPLSSPCFSVVHTPSIFPFVLPSLLAFSFSSLFSLAHSLTLCLSQFLLPLLSSSMFAVCLPCSHSTAPRGTRDAPSGLRQLCALLAHHPGGAQDRVLSPDEAAGRTVRLHGRGGDCVRPACHGAGRFLSAFLALWAFMLTSPPVLPPSG